MRSKNKQIAAIICIVLLVLIYVATLVVSLLDFPNSDRLFAVCLGATMGLPILFWMYVALYGKFTQKNTFADLFPKDDSSNDNAESNTNDASVPEE